MNKETKQLIKRLEYHKNKCASFEVNWWDLDESKWMKQICKGDKMVEETMYILDNKNYSAAVIKYIE